MKYLRNIQPTQKDAATSAPQSAVTSRGHKRWQMTIAERIRLKRMKTMDDRTQWLNALTEALREANRYAEQTADVFTAPQEPAHDPRPQIAIAMQCLLTEPRIKQNLPQ